MRENLNVLVLVLVGCNIEPLTSWVCAKSDAQPGRYRVKAHLYKQLHSHHQLFGVQ